MPSLSELSQAFTKYRRTCGQKPKGIRYPAPLRVAVCQIVASNPGINLDEVAKSLCITSGTLHKWLKAYVPSEVSTVPQFVELKVEDSTLSPLQLSRGQLSITLSGTPTDDEVEKLIRLLLAG